MVSTSSSERIVLKDMTCPVIRLDKSRRRDKSVSFSISLFFHALIFVMVGVSLIKQPEFGVNKGTSGIEISLEAAPTEPVPLAEPVKEIQSPSTETIPIMQAQPKPKIETPPVEMPIKQAVQGKDKITFHSTGGAIIEAKPDYFKNPAPPYPWEARQKGWQGTVVLKAMIDKEGKPSNVEIEKSSGHLLLDRTALEAVRKWKFKAAQLGDMPIESSVRVPVKFYLEDS